MTRDDMNRVCDRLFHARQGLDRAKERLRTADRDYQNAQQEFEAFYRPMKPDFHAPKFDGPVTVDG